jgi:hypothetical protein
MPHVITFHNMGSGQDEAVIYATREEAVKARQTEWFRVYPCKIYPVVNVNAGQLKGI